MLAQAVSLSGLEPKKGVMFSIPIHKIAWVVGDGIYRKFTFWFINMLEKRHFKRRVMEASKNEVKIYKMWCVCKFQGEFRLNDREVSRDHSNSRDKC